MHPPRCSFVLLLTLLFLRFVCARARLVIFGHKNWPSTYSLSCHVMCRHTRNTSEPWFCHRNVAESKAKTTNSNDICKHLIAIVCRALICFFKSCVTMEMCLLYTFFLLIYRCFASRLDTFQFWVNQSSGHDHIDQAIPPHSNNRVFIMSINIIRLTQNMCARAVMCARVISDFDVNWMFDNVR